MRQNRRVVRNTFGMVRLYLGGEPVARGHLHAHAVAIKWTILYNVVEYFDYFGRDR